MTCIETYSGQKIKFPFPDLDEIRIQDIAHALSLTCRFAGHCSHFYSVAQHSMNLTVELESRGCGPRLLLLGLLHDASEAYIGDMPTPLKRLLPAYRDIERIVQRTIWAGLGIIPPSPWEKYVIKWTDELLLGLEAQGLMKCRDGWNQQYIKRELPLSPKHFDYTPPAIIKDQFLATFANLTPLHAMKGGVPS